MHVPSEMGILITANNSSAGSVLISATVPTGQSAATTTFATANRDTFVPVGSIVPSLIMNLTARENNTEGMLEYIIFKVERANAVPTSANSQLPSAADISTQGLQQAMRTHQPGRVIRFGILPFAGEQPVATSFKINLAKFKFSKFRQGDYLMIQFFARGSAVTVDYHLRGNAYT